MLCFAARVVRNRRDAGGTWHRLWPEHGFNCDNWSGGTPTERLQLIPAGQKHRESFYEF